MLNIFSIWRTLLSTLCTHRVGTTCTLRGVWLLSVCNELPKSSSQVEYKIEIVDNIEHCFFIVFFAGKWHAGYHTAEYLPTNRGFHTFRGMLRGQGDHYQHARCV